jgi:hypothetical protein
MVSQGEASGAATQVTRSNRGDVSKCPAESVNGVRHGIATDEPQEATQEAFGNVAFNSVSS